MFMSTAVASKLNAHNSTNNDTIYHDAKFGFNYTNTSTNMYNVTVSKKDNEFDTYHVQFIYTYSYVIRTEQCS